MSTHNQRPTKLKFVEEPPEQSFSHLHVYPHNIIHELPTIVAVGSQEPESLKNSDNRRSRYMYTLYGKIKKIEEMDNQSQKIFFWHENNEQIREN